MFSNKMIILRLIIVVLLCTLIAGCVDIRNNESIIRARFDIYQEVFDGSEISILFGAEKSGIQYNDTLYFDSEGRLIKREDGICTTRWDYDSNNYLTRRFHFSDVLSNYLITHELRKDTLYEYWFPLNSPIWEHKLSDIDSSGMRVDFYLLNQGRPMKFVDSYGNYDIYNYDDIGKLLKIEKYSKSGELAVDESYYYQSGKLIRVDEKHYEGDFFESVYFTSGTLDSIVDRDFTKVYAILERHVLWGGHTDNIRNMLYPNLYKNQTYDYVQVQILRRLHNPSYPFSSLSFGKSEPEFVRGFKLVK